MTLKVISNVLLVGECPGGTYKDGMGKDLPCPRKNIRLEASSLNILTQPDLRNLTTNCPRCGAKIKLTPQINTAARTQLVDIADY